MRPNTSYLTDQRFTEAPELKGSYLALGRQLADGGAGAAPEALALVDILRELQASARSAMNGRIMASQDDRKSLRDDLRRSLEAIGPALKKLLGAAVDDLSHELGRMPEHLSNAGGARLMFGHARALLERLEQPEAARAGWRDVVSTFESDASAEACELSIAQLRAVSELRGHEWSELSGRLRGILVDSVTDVARAQGRPLDINRLTSRAGSGVPVVERFELTERAAGEPPSEGAIVIWLAYVNAHLGSPFHLRIGDHLTLYGSDLWDEGSVLKSDGCPRPPELDDPERSLFFRERPADTFVLLRVDLGRHEIHGARKRARAIAEILPDLVDTSSGWRLMEGEMGWVEDGGWFGTVGFEDPAEKALRSIGWGRYTDPMGVLLADFDPRLIDRLVEGDSDTEDLFDGYRWRGAAHRAPDVAQRVVLAIQAIERLLFPSPTGAPSSGARWAELVERYLKWMWSQHQISTFVWNAGYYGVHALSDRHEPCGGVLFRRFSRQLIDEGRTGFKPIHVELEATARAASELASHIDRGRMEARLLEEVASRTTAPECAKKWLDDYAGRFRILLRRAVRQRNVVTHGGLTTPEILESVERFVGWIENMLLGAHYHALNERKDPAVILQRWRVNALQRRVKLDGQADPVFALLA
jgi:hypothetical protein